jgi:hypothetical protein
MCILRLKDIQGALQGIWGIYKGVIVRVILLYLG